MVDDAIEDCLRPGGSPAILLQHHRCHTILKGLEIESQIVVTFYDEFYDDLCRFTMFYVTGTKRSKLS